jgi:hypothetical protein
MNSAAYLCIRHSFGMLENLNLRVWRKNTPGSIE